MKPLSGRMPQSPHLDDSATQLRAWERVLTRFAPIYLAFVVLVISSAPSYGWQAAAFMILDLVKGVLTHLLGSRMNRVGAAYDINQYSGAVLIGAIVFVSGGVGSPFLPFLVVFAGIFPILYRESRAIGSFAFLIVVAVVASLGPAQSSDLDGVFRFGTLVCVILSLRVFGTDLLNSGLDYRAASLIDQLTGLPNRRFFNKELKTISAELASRPESAALIICDVDHFKRVNDTYGHATGDVVLEQVASILGDSFRSHDRAFRIGGEEFAILVRGVNAERALSAANQLRQQIVVARPADIEVSMSFGVAMHEGDTGRQWLKRADQALYKAKDSGRNRVELAERLRS